MRGALILFLVIGSLMFGVGAFRPLRPSAVRATSSLWQTEIAVAFERVKEAANKFTDAESKETAMKIVKQLEETSYQSWKTQSLHLIDECLLEEGDACEAFSAAMAELRHKYEASAGNG